MKNESVAVLDIRSSEVTFLVGARGVNDTFVVYGVKSVPYDGYDSDGFCDENSLKQAISVAVDSVRQRFEGSVEKVFVGVPSAFTSVTTRGHSTAFSSKRKIGAADVEALYEKAFDSILSQKVCIHRSDMYFSLGDNRKYFGANALYGVYTSSLQGGLCFYFVDEKFYAILNGALGAIGINEIEYLPASLAQALYLLPQKRREGYAVLLDVGLVSTTLSVVYGNGIVREESYEWGLGYVYACLSEKLGVDYERAAELVATANVARGADSDEPIGQTEDGEPYSERDVNEIIKFALDALCEKIDGFFSKYYRTNTALVDVNPVAVTGEGIGRIMGELGHISTRLNRITQTVYPELPYYDKPAFSSRMALLNMALGEEKKETWLRRIFKKFGGKR